MFSTLFFCSVVMLSLCCHVLVPPFFFSVHSEGPLLYCLLWWVFTILSINHFCLGVGVLPNHPLVCQLPSHHHLPVLAIPLPITRQKVLFCLLAHRGIPIWIRVGILSHYPSWHAPSDSNLFFPFFGWYVIPARHFPQKSLSGNPKIGSLLLPTTRPYPLLPLTYGPPPLYWLGTGWWCLSLVRATFPCVSMACLQLIRLQWPEVLSVHSTARSWPFVVWMVL